MPETPRGYPYPVLDNPNNVPQYMQALAEAIDADVASIDGQFSDSGWWPINLAAGWSPVGNDRVELRVLNRVTYFRGRVVATAAAGSNMLAAPLPESARPSSDMPCLVGSTDGTAAMRVVQVNANGEMHVFKGNQAVTDLPLASIAPIPVG